MSAIAHNVTVLDWHVTQLKGRDENFYSEESDNGYDGPDTVEEARGEK